MSAGPTGKCALVDGPSTSGDSDLGEQSGIYLISPNNHVVGNRVSGQDNALFINQQGGAIYGQDIAQGRVAANMAPFGVHSHNVFHDCAGFGWYINGHFPLNVEVDHNGYVVDWRHAVPYHPLTGEDQALAVEVTHHIEYHNDFSIGAYDFGDVTLRNLTVSGSLKGHYWKTYRRGVNSGPLCVNCRFAGNFPSLVQAPGGQGLVEWHNSTWDEESGAIDLNHHCALGGEATGGLCSSHFLFSGESQPTRYCGDDCGVKFVDEVGNATSSLVSLRGVTMFHTAGYPVFSYAACEAEDGGTPGSSWMACPDSWGVRSVRIFSPDRGVLTVSDSVSGVTTAVPWRNAFNKWKSAGRYDGFSPIGRSWPVGYTFLVRDGARLTIDVPTALTPTDSTHYDTFTMEYSEAVWPAENITSITVTVTGDARLAGGPCAVSSTHSRSWITPYGPLLPKSGAWYGCVEWEVGYTPVGL